MADSPLMMTMSKTNKLSVVFVLVCTAASAWVTMAEEGRRPHTGHHSIVGYAPEDLKSHDRLMKLFEEWVVQYRKKAYASVEEKLHRFEVFKDNLKHIDDVNKQVTSYWLGLNAFADLTHDEFKAAYLGLLQVPSPSDRRTSGGGSFFRYGEVSRDKLPAEVDWRSKGAVTEVKNQGQCGSCWAFSAVAAVEGINQIATGNLTSLSEQELIDCSTGDGNNGCHGGTMDRAFAYVAAAGGLHTEDAYPYLTEQRDCTKPSSSSSDTTVVSISGYEDVPANDESALLKALAHQPVSVAVEASGRHFQFYRGGVFDGPCGDRLDHGVAAVGYGKDHIVVKNSWGTHWGENGYIRIKRGTGKRHGLCGIYKMASYPTKDNQHHHQHLTAADQ